MKAGDYIREHIPTMVGEHHVSGMKLTTLISLLNGYSEHTEVNRQREQLINFLTWHDSENLGCLPDGVEGRVDEYLKLITDSE